MKLYGCRYPGVCGVGISSVTATHPCPRHYQLFKYKQNETRPRQVSQSVWCGYKQRDCCPPLPPPLSTFCHLQLLLEFLKIAYTQLQLQSEVYMLNCLLSLQPRDARIQTLFANLQYVVQLKDRLYSTIYHICYQNYKNKLVSCMQYS